MLVIVFLVVPLGFAVLFGSAAYMNEPPLVFNCRRCAQLFTRKAWHSYPRLCPHCRARDWNL